jgi:cytochrome c peroxidase
MITGIRPTAEVAVRAGFRHIQFALVDENDARAVDHYLRSLKPVPSPYLVDGKLSAKALKGQQIFEDQKCSYCHPSPYYTDGKKHEIGTPGISDRTNKWDTPTLLEVWRTAPYLHDGRSATMMDLLISDKHGIRSDLSPEEFEQLAEYVLSL